MNLETHFLNNPLLAWLTALGIAVVINAAVALFKSVAQRRLVALASRTETLFDDALVEVISKTRQWLVLLVALYIGSRYLELPSRVDSALLGAATVGAFIQIGLWLATLLEFYLTQSRVRAAHADTAAATSFAALSFIGRLLIWSAIALLILENLGVDVTALVAGLGVGGIAVALAVQNILGDLFASLSIVLDKPFQAGDFIVVDSFMGTVEHVGLKTTRVRSLSGEQLVFANGDLLEARLRNYKRMHERRIEFGFGLLYQTDIAAMARIPGIVRTIIESQPKTRFDRAHFKSFGESSLDFEVIYWMLDPDFNLYMDTQQAINLALMESFAAEGVDFAYPTRTLMLDGTVRLARGRAAELAGNAQ